mgnify:CR=1 FL=1
MVKLLNSHKADNGCKQPHGKSRCVNQEKRLKVKWGQRQKRGCERRSRKGKGKERERKRKKRKKLYKEATRQKRVSDTLKASRNIANAEVS